MAINKKTLYWWRDENTLPLQSLIGYSVWSLPEPYRPNPSVSPVTHVFYFPALDTKTLFPLPSPTQAGKTVRTTKITTRWICPSAQSRRKVRPRHCWVRIFQRGNESGSFWAAVLVETPLWCVWLEAFDVGWSAEASESSLKEEKLSLERVDVSHSGWSAACGSINSAAFILLNTTKKHLKVSVCDCSQSPIKLADNGHLLFCLLHCMFITRCCGLGQSPRKEMESKKTHQLLNYKYQWPSFI